MTWKSLAGFALILIISVQFGFWQGITSIADAQSTVKDEAQTHNPSCLNEQSCKQSDETRLVIHQPILPGETPSRLEIEEDNGAEQSKTKREMDIQISPSSDLKTASVMVNGKEVVRFREAIGGLTPLERAQAMSERLSRFLAQGGDPEQIRAAKMKGSFVIQAGQSPLATVDAQTAKIAGMQPEKPALVWSNQLRQSLGKEELTPQQCPTLLQKTGLTQTGLASWYGGRFHGRRTASGVRFDSNALTAAHPRLPFGTLVRVYHHSTGQSCIVKIVDRGPYAHGRIIDLSAGAARAIGLLRRGVGRVTIEVVNANG